MTIDVHEVHDILLHRIHRGNNDAVERICDISKLREFADLIKNSNSIPRDQIWIKLLETYSGRTY